MLHTRPFNPGSDFGIEILDLRLDEELPERTIREIIRLFHKHQVMRIPGQRNMRMADFERFGNWFGNPHPHVVEKGRVDGFAGISLLTNADAERRNAAAFWHTDNTYERQPASATMLWAHTVPAKGGETLVADMYTAYESLPEAMKRRIEGMKTVNGWYRRDEGFIKKELPYLTEAQLRELGVATHPLVKTHPVTGRKALYSVTGSSFGIEGMPPDEGLELLRELTRHALQPQNIVSVSYQAGDIAAWDTLATLHSATPHEAPEEGEGRLREMYRISIKGLSPYAIVPAAEAVAA